MNDMEYVRRLGTMYQKILSLKTNDDYVINQPQMDKFVEVLDFFLDRARELDGNVKPVKLNSKVSTGDLIATFVVFDVAGDDVQVFSRIISYCSAVGIDASNEGEVCISCTVPSVFVPLHQ